MLLNSQSVSLDINCKINKKRKQLQKTKYQT